MTTTTLNPTPSQLPLLDMRDVAILIKDKQVVRNASLAIHMGETVGLVGESGSGKSMMCRAAIGLLGPIGARVSSGSILVRGQSVDDANTATWRQIRGHQIGYVPQASLAGLDPLMRIDAQLRETIRTLDAGADSRQRAFELLNAVRINQPREVLRAYPHQLSGGMRQRVMIALALAGRPDLIIADEATTALDATVQKAVLNLLRDLQRETNMALIIVTHDLGIVRQVSDRLYVMNGGLTVESGSTDSVLRTPRHEYTKTLLSADPSRAAASAPSEVVETDQRQPNNGSSTAVKPDEAQE